MLVLKRRNQQEIVIGEGSNAVRIVVLAGGNVTLGIQAAKEVPVHRAELLEKPKAEAVR